MKVKYDYIYKTRNNLAAGLGGVSGIKYTPEAWPVEEELITKHGVVRQPTVSTVGTPHAGSMAAVCEGVQGSRSPQTDSREGID